MKKLLQHLGKYFILLNKVFSMPEKRSVFINQLSQEFKKIGIDSIGIVTIISFFIGAVISYKQLITLKAHYTQNI